MSKKSNKYQFLKSLRNTVLNKEQNILVNEKLTEKKQEENLNIEKKNESIKDIEKKKVILPYKNISDSSFLDEKFAENFVNSGGKFIYCENNIEFFHFLNSLKKEKKWNHIFSWNYDLLDFLQSNRFQQNEISIEMADADAAMSYCYKLSANEGVIVLSPEQATNRRIVNFPKSHIIIAYKNQLKETILDAISGFSENYGERLPSLLELHEGKPVCKENHQLLLNADGPTDVYLFYIDTDIVD